MVTREGLTQKRKELTEKYGKIFGQNLYKAIKANKQYGTIRSLAEKLDISPNSMGAYIHGAMLPTLSTLIAISDLLGISIDQLLGRKQGLREISQNETYGDYARAILSLCNADVLDFEKDKETGQYKVILRDKELQKLVDDYAVFCKLEADNGEQGKRIYKEWMINRLEQMDNMAIDYEVRIRTNADFNSINKQDASHTSIE